MRLLIDMQGCQVNNEAKDKEINIVYLVERIVSQAKDYEVILFLNNALPISITAINELFADLIPVKNIRVYEALKNVSYQQNNKDRRYAMTLIRESVINELQPDAILITSMFEGWNNDAVISINNLAVDIPTAVIVHASDLATHEETKQSEWYLEQLNYLQRADLLLTVSEKTQREAVKLLNYPSDRIKNISYRDYEIFKPITQQEQSYLGHTYGINFAFILYIQSDSDSDCVEELTKIYNEFSDDIKDKYKLVIVNLNSKNAKPSLQSSDYNNDTNNSDLIFIDSVSKNDLVIFYKACELLLSSQDFDITKLSDSTPIIYHQLAKAINDRKNTDVAAYKILPLETNDYGINQKRIAQFLLGQKSQPDTICNKLITGEMLYWEKTAGQAWSELTSLTPVKKEPLLLQPSKYKKRLAYVSPLPPVKSGISKYSAELLPELAKFYDVDVIINQPTITDSWINSNCQIRDVKWLRDQSASYDRVMYHFGNSEFHAHMIELLLDIPGIVVMHENHLADLIAFTDTLSPEKTYHWLSAFLNTHGWKPIYKYCSLSDEHKYSFTFGYPCNQQIIQSALGIIVHSSYPKKITDSYYGYQASKDWAQIPLLRVPAIKANKKQVRKKLKIKQDAFVVCSFGLLGSTKLNDRLLSAWLSSPLADKSECYLVFVGEAIDTIYNNELVERVKRNRTASHISITGWVDDTRYHDWLNAADIGVQLRGMSLGETSAAVLDCMNYGLATIVNANGSMADLDKNTVYLLPDTFSDEELIEALSKLYLDKTYRDSLSENAANVINTLHRPDYCAEQYAQSIEHFYERADSRTFGLIKRLAALAFSQQDVVEISNVMAVNFPPAPRRKKLFVDITVLTIVDSKTGIQRVVKAILKQFLLNPPANYDVQAVYIQPDGLGYRYARKFTCNFLNLDSDWFEDEILDIAEGDIFLGLDLNMAYIPAEKDSLMKLSERGLKVYFVVYDLLPILLPETFYDYMESSYQQWIDMIIEFDGAVCISKAVADELSDWIDSNQPNKKHRFSIDWFNLGADIGDALPSTGMPSDAESLLKKLQSDISFLMVGTIEPRKCHEQTLHAFDELWKQGIEVNLIIVGKRGWLTEPLIEEIENHPLLNAKLFWLEQCSDEYLEKLYGASTCLIAASKGEGFGLPIIEAVKHKLPVIARDIPVFREVTSDGAFYFTGLKPSDMEQAIKDWLTLLKQGNVPCPEKISWLTWEQSAEQLLNVVLNKFENQQIH